MGGQYLRHSSLFFNVIHVYICIYMLDMYLSIYHIIEMLFTKPQIGRIRYNMFFFSYVMLNC